jgi:DNA-binding CsgD family transcriptional regulator
MTPTRPAEPAGPPAAAGAAHPAQDAILAIYQATMAPDAWPRIVAALAPLFGCAAGAFVRLDRIHPRDSRMEFFGLTEPYTRSLRTRDISTDVLWQELLKRPAGDVLRSTDAVPPQVLAGNPLYRNIAVPAGMTFALLGVLENLPHSFANVAVTRSGHDFDEAELALMRELVPHLRIAMELESRIALGDAGRQQALGSFDRAGQPLVVLDRTGYALHANELARRILARADGVELKFGRFLFANLAVQGAFERALRLALATTGADINPPPQELRVPRLGAGSPLALSVVSCTNSADRAVLPPGAGCVVMIYDADHPRRLPLDRLAWLYRLTPAEVRVCEALYGAGSVESAANAMSLTRHTVRTHMKSIYAKFGVATQGQLMQKLANSVWLAEGRGSTPAAD